MILANVLIDNRLMSQAVEDLNAEDFYSPLNRRVFAAMRVLFEAKKPIDPIMIGEELKKEGSLESVGGVAVITNLTFGMVHMPNLSEYISTVVKTRQVRDLIRSCSQITANALAGEDDYDAILKNAQASIDAVCTRDEKQGFESIGHIVRGELEKIRQLRDREIEATGFRTGFKAIDFITGGFQPTDLIVIGGRPGMGKTMLAGQIAINACEIDPKAVVAIFSHEMSKEQLAQRFMASSAQADLTRMKRGASTLVEMADIQRAAERFDGMKIVLDDTSTLTATQMRAKLLRLRHEQGRLDCVIVDYLQRMHAGRKTEGRQQEVSAIARELKSLAKDMNVPVIALSSMSRANEGRQSKRPVLSDLRESGDIESEADMVAFLYRENYYDQNANPALAEFLIEKHRHGPCESIKLHFMPEFTMFRDYEC